MFKNAMVAAVIVVFGSAALAHADTKEDIKAGLKKLTESGFSWKQTVEGAAGAAAGRGGGGEGKYQADGLTWVSRTMGQNTVAFVMKGDKGALKAGEAGWVSIETPGDDQAAQRAARQAKNFKLPTVQAQTSIESAMEFTKVEEAWSAALSEDAVKALMTYGGRARGGAGANANAAATPPVVKDAKGSVKVWLKDGAVTKIAYNVKGTVTANGQDRDIDRTTTIEFSEVGTTKIEVPAEAKEKAGLS